ncbi:MAG TPA: hypothetical protein DGG94_10245, partial [Micromonosporaceae bacterium]|nr:hypothetical protein [Micromonosporaceae bacterium]
MRGGEDPADVLWGEELRDGDGAGDRAEEAVGVLLIAGERTQQHLHLRRRWLQRGELARELIHRHHRLVAAPFVAAESLVERIAAGEGDIQRLG